jgi:hypothetical protein
MLLSTVIINFMKVDMAIARQHKNLSKRANGQFDTALEMDRKSYANRANILEHTHAHIL